MPGEHLLTSIRKWMVVGPFDLGVQSAPEGLKLETAPPRFVQALEPEKNWDITQTYPSDSKMITWQEAETEEEGWVNFDLVYGGDYGIAYGLCHIHAPDDQKVFAAFKCDALSKIFVKGEQVYSAGFSFDLNYFMLPLTKGWNAVLVKCAAYTGGWRYTLQIAGLNAESCQVEPY